MLEAWQTSNGRLELSSYSLIQFVAFSVTLSLRCAWREAHQLTIKDIVDAVFHCQCIEPDNNALVHCANCRESPVSIGSSSSALAPIVVAASTNSDTAIETYTFDKCIPRCSRNHLGRNLALVVVLAREVFIMSPNFSVCGNINEHNLERLSCFGSVVKKTNKPRNSSITKFYSPTSSTSSTSSPSSLSSSILFWCPVCESDVLQQPKEVDQLITAQTSSLSSIIQRYQEQVTELLQNNHHHQHEQRLLSLAGHGSRPKCLTILVQVFICTLSQFEVEEMIQDINHALGVLHPGVIKFGMSSSGSSALETCSQGPQRQRRVIVCYLLFPCNKQERLIEDSRVASLCYWQNKLAGFPNIQGRDLLASGEMSPVMQALIGKTPIQ